MGPVDATCLVCGKAIRWEPAFGPRKCAEHTRTLTALEQATAIVRDLVADETAEEAK
jgi:predicted nucleic acid-binding Zn ribbon protein